MKKPTVFSRCRKQTPALFFQRGEEDSVGCKRAMRHRDCDNDAPPCDGAILPLPSTIRASVLIGGFAVNGQLALDGEDLLLTLGDWSTEAHNCAPGHIWATFAASVKGVEGTRVSVLLAPSAPLAGAECALHWVRCGDHIGLRAHWGEVETLKLSR